LAEFRVYFIQCIIGPPPVIMNRGGALPGGLANLNDTIQVIDRDGTDLGLMIVAEAQKLASQQGAELFVTRHTAKPPVVHIVIVRKARTG
jgi:Translation initiation factor IF-3, N-terminal domain